MKKKVSGMNYRQGEIVLLPFPFSDLSGTKKRPVLIVSSNTYNAAFRDVIVCVITSKTKDDDYSINLRNEDLRGGILPEPSVIKCHKLFTIEKRLILKRFSELKSIKLKEVIEKIGLVLIIEEEKR